MSSDGEASPAPGEPARPSKPGTSLHDGPRHRSAHPPTFRTTDRADTAFASLTQAPQEAAPNAVSCPSLPRRSSEPSGPDSATPERADYNPAAYGDGCAEFYDQLYPHLPAPVLSTLLGLAGGQPLLDLGVGTGRAAIPLARRGCEVWGIDASHAMLRRLRERADGLSIIAVHADLACFALPLRFGLIASLVNTLALLPPQDQQECLSCAAAHLRAGGRLLIESIGPTAAKAHTGIIIHTDAGPREYRVRLYASTLQQLDRMAAQAGLVPKDRWQDWTGRQWHASAPTCIGLYGKP